MQNTFLGVCEMEKMPLAVHKTGFSPLLGHDLWQRSAYIFFIQFFQQYPSGGMPGLPRQYFRVT